MLAGYGRWQKGLRKRCSEINPKALWEETVQAKTQWRRKGRIDPENKVQCRKDIGAAKGSDLPTLQSPAPLQRQVP
jgi:hypothetical protein